MTIDNGVMRLSGTLKLKGGTSEAMSTVNPILASREIAVETDTGQMKVGNGVNHWNDLKYTGSSSSSGSSTSSIVVSTLMIQGIINEPPETPNLGDYYIIGDSPTGDFSGVTPKYLAHYVDNSWSFISPSVGLEIINITNGQLLRYIESNWINIANFTMNTTV